MQSYKIKYNKTNSNIINANIEKLKEGNDYKHLIYKNINKLSILGKGYASVVYDAPLVIKMEYDNNSYQIEKKAMIAFNMIEIKPFKVPNIYSFDDPNFALFLEKINTEKYVEYKDYLKTSQNINDDLEFFIERIFLIMRFLRSDNTKEKLEISKGIVEKKISDLDFSKKLKDFIQIKMQAPAVDFPDVLNKLKEIESNTYRYNECLLVMDLSLDLFYNHDESDVDKKFYLHDLNACQIGPQEYDIAYFLSNFHFWLKRTISENEYNSLERSIIDIIQRELSKISGLNWNLLRGGLLSASLLKGDWTLANNIKNSSNLIEDLFDN